MIIIILSLALSVTATHYDFKCPDTSHRKYRSKWLCNSTGENYSCLLDIQRKKFRESCTFTSDFVRPGRRSLMHVNRHERYYSESTKFKREKEREKEKYTRKKMWNGQRGENRKLFHLTL